MKRRQALIALGLGAAGLTARKSQGIDYLKPVKEAENLTAYLNGKQVLLRWNNRPLTAYRAHDSLKYPYFYPLNGLKSGTSLTTESALPYPHHRGLWLGCEPMNGGDYWGDSSLDRGQIESVGLELGKTTANRAIINDKCRWIRKDAPSPLRDRRTFTISVPNERLWMIDAEFTLTAQEDITVKKAKHSFFAIRAASDISPTYGGILMNSEGGTGAKGTYGKEATWCGYHGKRANQPDVVEGIAVMTHPRNPFPPIWFTRDYGHLSPSPFNFQEKPWTLKKGQSIELKYRIVIHTGDPKEAQLDDVYKQWIKSTAG